MRLSSFQCSLIFLITQISIYITCSSSSSVQEWNDEKDLGKFDETGPQNHRLFLFYAEWCGACKRYKPKFLQLAPKLIQLSPINLEIIQINLDNAPRIGSRFRISHLPAVYHQIDGEFRKVDGFQIEGKLEKYFEGKGWVGAPSMSPLSPPRGSNPTGGAPSKKSEKFSIDGLVQNLGISLPVFVLLSSTVLLLIALFSVWCIWLYTDYKLNAHKFTEEAIKERIKILRKLPEFEAEFYDSESEFDKEDSGEESDTESEVEEKDESKNERAPLRGRRSSLKNRLK